MRYLARDSRGVSAVEFSLVAPLVIFFMMAIMDIGRYALLADSMRSGIDRAGRVAMVSSQDSASPATVASLKQIVRDNVKTSTPDDLSVSVTWKDGSNSVGSEVTVAASHRFDFVSPEFYMVLMPRTISVEETYTIVN